MDPLVEGNNQMALNLHKIIAADEKNTCFSPFSLSTVMTMLLHGIRGESETELRKCLGFSGVGNDVLLKSFRDLASSLNTSSDGYTVSNANCVFVTKGFEVLEQYQSDLTEYFRAGFFQADIQRQPEVARTEINKWVKGKTCNKIPELLPKLLSSTVMVLLNAIYFKGSWLKQFRKKSTSKQLFLNNGLKKMAKKVEMMHTSETFNVAVEKSYKVVELPYVGEEMAMLVFLPNSNEGLQEIENSLKPGFISEIRSMMSRIKVDLALPKFKVEYGAELKETFEALEVRRIFAPLGDFGGMSDDKYLFVSKVIHKAVLKVNEEGCEAAAASAVLIGRCLPKKIEFVVDHPFMFVIYNRKNDLILFMGRIVEL